MTIMCLALASLMDSLDSTSILLLMHKVKVTPVRFVPVSEILPMYHSLWVMTISVTLLIEVPGKLMICFFPNDPLWDGQGCGGTSTCCEFSNPKWFCKQLPQPTTDDIEMTLCENNVPRIDDSPFEVVDLYIN